MVTICGYVLLIISASAFSLRFHSFQFSPISKSLAKPSSPPSSEPCATSSKEGDKILTSISASDLDRFFTVVVSTAKAQPTIFLSSSAFGLF